MPVHDPREWRVRPSIAVRSFPADDEAFRAVVRSAVARALGRGRLASLGDRIQGNVRRRYPNCRIRVQDTLAASDGELVVYAYREGTILRSTDWGRMLDAREREEQAEAV
jgi:hypothetical protein